MKNDGKKVLKSPIDFIIGENSQKVELEMLIEVDRICRKNNIKYSIMYGTLLGAVRNGGFIPWDDDCDVVFKRDEYEKFFEACKKDLDTSKFFLQEHRTDPNYLFGYGKLRRKNNLYSGEKVKGI